MLKLQRWTIQTWMTKVLTGVTLLILLLGNPQAHAAAQSAPAAPVSPLQISSVDGGVTIAWGAGVDSDMVAAAALPNLPTMRYQGYDLPMQLVTLQLSDAVAASALQVEQLASVAWQGTLQPAVPLQPLALDWEDNSDLMADEVVALPDAPVFILRQGIVNGESIAIIAISPLYQENGAIKLATNLKVNAVGAKTVTDNLLTQPRASVGIASPALVPTNNAATMNAIKIKVSQPGLQKISAATLISAGLNPGAIDVTKLHLYYKGTEIPLETIQSPSFELRFYAVAAGDRWNASDAYWLTLEATNGLRMATRQVTPGSAPTTGVAFEEGSWVQNREYQSRQAGVDGDHWFHKTLEVKPSQLGQPSTYPTVTVPLHNVLPVADGVSTFTLTLSVYYRSQYSLSVNLAGTTQEINWNSSPAGSLIQDWSLPFSTTANLSELQLTLLPGKSIAGLNFDHVLWQRPVALDFQNKGAAFTGLSGEYVYAWHNAPLINGQLQLYDVTNPLVPAILTGATSTGFQDGPEPHRYLLAGPESVQTPEAVAHGPVVFGSGTGADAIYIAPPEFLATLEPLLAHRRAQGYTVAAIDVNTIYDAWSYGQVSPEAIRSFLRFAHANWQPTPVSVVLVGDATWDPHNYEEKNNTNFIPAYMADVDPWLGETACENCFVQLDGEDPLTGDAASGEFFKTDMWIGRFPVKSTVELTGVVNKIIHYETGAKINASNWTTVFLADNYIKGVDSNNKPIYDPAGDFAKLTDANIDLFPSSVKNNRIYYDPYPNISDPQGTQPWRNANANTIKTDILSKLSAGAGLVVYNGHSHHWQWAITDPALPENWMLGLYDTDLLTNYDALSITLSMTCYTSQFPKPAVSGTVLDERNFLNAKGGSVAVWGPAGLSVAHGHDSLQRGFYKALWAAPPMQAKLGELLAAGYNELLTKSTCCQDALQTFVLLGDPLTPARLIAPDNIFLPIVNGR